MLLLEATLAEGGKASQQRGFTARAQDLWRDKKLVPVRGRADLPAREAYRLSLEHSRHTEITKEELCSLTWAFRFKREPLPVAG